MKNLYILLLFFPLVIFSCSAQSESKKAIKEYLETQNGVRTNLKIEFLSFDVSDITVSDSISFLQTQYESEKCQKLESAEKSIKHWKNAIEKQKGKNNQVVAKALISNYSKKLTNAENDLKLIQEWKPDYLNRYNSFNQSDILAKKVVSHFSFLNPRLQTRQEIHAIFILSADGKKCNKMIKQ